MLEFTISLKADLEAVFEHADGFLLVDQDVGAFIPELKRAEAALFPADAPLTLKSLELVTRLDMVGRAVGQLSMQPQSLVDGRWRKGCHQVASLSLLHAIAAQSTLAPYALSWPALLRQPAGGIFLEGREFPGAD